MFGFIAAMISGALMSIQGIFNTQLGKQSGNWTANAFVQFTGFLVCMVLWFFKERGKGNVTQIMNAEPKYLLSGGLIGAFITITVMAGMAKLGPAKAVMLIVAAQLVVAYLIEVLGLFGAEKIGFDWMKLLATGLFLAGIILFKIRE